MSEQRQTATAFAPASIGNVGVGFDVLGLAIAGVGDRVTARLVESPGVHIAQVLDPDGKEHPILSSDPEKNTASIAARSLWEAHAGEAGIELTIAKGIPLQSGMGSSAASAVAAVVAANALLESPLAVSDLLEHALVGEEFASGGKHADNVAPCLLGGMVVCPTVLYPQTISVPIPSGVKSVLLHPELKVNTSEARRVLPADIPLGSWVDQQGLLAAFVTACAQGDLQMMSASLKDVIVEPRRSAAVPCFDDVKAAALANGALGCSLSGSGPSIFAIAADDAASGIGAAMLDASQKAGIDGQVWISPLDGPGAILEN